MHTNETVRLESDIVGHREIPADARYGVTRSAALAANAVAAARSATSGDAVELDRDRHIDQEH